MLNLRRDYWSQVHHIIHTHLTLYVYCVGMNTYMIHTYCVWTNICMIHTCMYAHTHTHTHTHMHTHNDDIDTRAERCGGRGRACHGEVIFTGTLWQCKPSHYCSLQYLILRLHLEQSILYWSYSPHQVSRSASCKGVNPASRKKSWEGRARWRNWRTHEDLQASPMSLRQAWTASWMKTDGLPWNLA